LLTVETFEENSAQFPAIWRRAATSIRIHQKVPHMRHFMPFTSAMLDRNANEFKLPLSRKIS
jgi:hypothetical protein